MKYTQISDSNREINRYNRYIIEFSKKHLGPLACASCEKNLVNMYGQAADYHVWKKLPFRDPSERIARYGQGFSKILSHMRPGDLLGSSGHVANQMTMIEQ